MPQPREALAVHRMAAAQQRKDGQGSGRLVREGSLEHQHRAMVGEATHLPTQPLHRGAVNVQRVVCGIARNHRDLHAAPDGFVDRETEATVGFRQVLVAVVQVREVRQSDHVQSLV